MALHHLTADAWGPQWSNAKAIWANAHPMSSEELITKQAEMVYADDPGVPGYMPRVWAYRSDLFLGGQKASSRRDRHLSWQKYDQGAELVFVRSGEAGRPQI